MVRPSQKLDQALLQSGRELFPALGCKGLSLRAVAQHANVNVGMFHYHFKTKDAFLNALLQGLYEEMFASFTLSIDSYHSTTEKLRAALTAMAHFARANRHVLARIWIDAMAGEEVAAAFFRRNTPRHLAVLFGLLQRAQQDGEIIALPPLQQFSTLAGAVLLPIIFVSGLFESSARSEVPTSFVVPLNAFETQVMSDDAIAQRIDLVLACLLVSSDKTVPGHTAQAAHKPTKTKTTVPASVNTKNNNARKKVAP